MKGYMYILLCGDGSYYVGSTNDLELRLSQHQSGEGSNHTRKHLPVKLIYFEEFDRIDDAFYREKQIQGWRRSKKEALIKGDKNTLIELSKNYKQYRNDSLRTWLEENSPSSGNVPSTWFDKSSPSSSGTGDIPSIGSENVPSTSSGTNLSINITVPSTGSGTGETTSSESDAMVTNFKTVAELVEATPSHTAPPVAEPVEATKFTIAQLITELQKYPQDTPVITDGYEGEYENILQPKLIRVKQMSNQAYYIGQYQLSAEADSFDAIVIQREVRPSDL
jgi:putative endonuclease